MTQREKLIKELSEVNKQWLNSEGSLVWGEYLANWVLADRARIVEPLVRHKNLILKVLGTSSWDEKDAPYNAIDESLKLAGIEK